MAGGATASTDGMTDFDKLSPAEPVSPFFYATVARPAVFYTYPGPPTHLPGSTDTRACTSSSHVLWSPLARHKHTLHRPTRRPTISVPRQGQPEMTRVSRPATLEPLELTCARRTETAARADRASVPRACCRVGPWLGDALGVVRCCQW